MRICIITCYKQPDYVRAKTLRAAAAEIDGVDVVVVKNKSKGVKRYLEVMVDVLNVRLQQKPDVYLVTFRGYEILLPIRLLTIGKPLIYDEFIHPMEWLAFEHKKIKPNGFAMKMFTIFYRLLLKSVRLTLTDTESHADLSAQLTRLNRRKIVSLPVGTDEDTFTVTNDVSDGSGDMKVLYYGNMLPLHGLEYVIEAAIKLKNVAARFVLIGGDNNTVKLVDAAIEKGAKIDYKKWVNYEELPALVNQAGVCLAGPFGDTYQAGYVITGKAYQYLAMGRPIIVGRNRESGVFVDKKNALIVQQASSSALSEAVMWAVNHPMELKALGLAGRKLYEDKYSNKVLSGRLYDILNTANLL